MRQWTSARCTLGLIRLFLGSCLILGYFSLARVVMHACDEAPDVWSFPPAYSDQYVKANTRSGECQRDLPVRVLGVKTKYRPELTRDGSTGQDHGPRSRLAHRGRVAHHHSGRPAQRLRLPGIYDFKFHCAITTLY